MMLIGMNPVGAMVAGFAAARWGAPLTITVGAVTCLVAALAFIAALPAFRVGACEATRNMAFGDGITFFFK